MVDPLSCFSFQASAPRLVYQKPWYVKSLSDGAYKRSIATDWRELAAVAQWLIQWLMGWYVLGSRPGSGSI